MKPDETVELCGETQIQSPTLQKVAEPSSSGKLDVTERSAEAEPIVDKGKKLEKPAEKPATPEKIEIKTPTAKIHEEPVAPAKTQAPATKAEEKAKAKASPAAQPTKINKTK